jgi:hypothetical protein
MVPSGANQIIKFKKQNKQTLTKQISFDDKYSTYSAKTIAPTTTKQFTSRTQNEANDEYQGKGNKKKEGKTRWDSDIITWNDENKQLESKQHGQNKTSSGGSIQENKVKQTDEFKTWIAKSKTKKKHKQHTSKLNSLVQQNKPSQLDINNIQEHQVENKKELIEWLNKLASKKTHISRILKQKMSVNTTTNTNRFSILATDDEGEMEINNTIETPITTVQQVPPKNNTQDTIMTIVDGNKKDNTNTATTTQTSRIIATQTPRSSVAPPIPKVQSTKWQVVGSKQDAKEEMYNNEEYSNRFSPVYLPPTPKYDEDYETEKYTKNVLPVTMRITAPRNYKVKNGRALVALMRILDNIHWSH